jgi:transposase-like protein
VNSSWRMDETAIRVRGKSAYLYRAVDMHGKSVDSLLREDRGIEAVQALFREAVATQQSSWPRTITLDGHAASRRAVRLLRGSVDHGPGVRRLSAKFVGHERTCDGRSPGVNQMLAIPPYSADSRVRFASRPAQFPLCSNKRSTDRSCLRMGKIEEQ